MTDPIENYKNIRKLIYDPKTHPFHLEYAEKDFNQLINKYKYLQWLDYIERFPEEDPHFYENRIKDILNKKTPQQSNTYSHKNLEIFETYIIEEINKDESFMTKLFIYQ